MAEKNRDRRRKKSAGGRDLSTRYQKTERLSPEEREKLQAELAAKRARREQMERQRKEASATRISYIRKPLAAHSYYALGLGTAAVLMAAFGFYGGVETFGAAPLRSGALGLCSMVTAMIALWYGFLSFLEKEKNYLLARIGLALGGVTLIFWMVIIIVGAGG